MSFCCVRIAVLIVMTYTECNLFFTLFICYILDAIMDIAFKFEQSGYLFREPDELCSLATRDITLVKLGTTEQTYSVAPNLTVTDSDYSISQETITIGPSDKSVTFVLTIANDDLFEATKFFEVSFRFVGDPVAASSSVRISLEDSDSKPAMYV